MNKKNAFDYLPGAPEKLPGVVEKGMPIGFWMLVQGGLTPHQALQSATIMGATTLGMDKDLGTLTPGKLADIIVIDGNPIDDIRQSEKVTWAMVIGRLHDAAAMNQTGARGEVLVGWGPLTMRIAGYSRVKRFGDRSNDVEIQGKGSLLNRKQKPGSGKR